MQIALQTFGANRTAAYDENALRIFIDFYNWIITPLFAFYMKKEITSGTRVNCYEIKFRYRQYNTDNKVIL